VYETVGHAVSAMLRWRERRRAAKAQGAMFDPPGRTGEDADALALTVDLLFARYDRRRYLTRLFIERKQISDFPGRERHRARKARNHFVRELCHRGMLEFQGESKDPQKSCPAYVHGQCPRFPRPDRIR
jgi:hypothetical protein